MTIETVQAAVIAALEPEGLEWLEGAQERIAADRSARTRLFPAVSRKCGAGALWTTEPELIGWTVADAVRALLLVGATSEDVTAIYNYGDAVQRRAVLRALPLLDLGEAAVPLVVDALHSSKPQLIAAAVGPYAAEHLPVEPWRQAVLTCVRFGIPMAWVADLERRTDDELVRRLRQVAEERVAAGRPVPGDVNQLIANRTVEQPVADPGEGP